MPRTDLIEFNGEVIEAMGGGFYSIKVDDKDGGNIRARLCGKMKMNKVRVMPGDDVRVGVSPHDMTHGIIVYRGRKSKR